MKNKTCPCGNSFFGRSNKIYCKPSCKSEANNARVAEANKSVDEIDKILMKNRKILAQLYNLFGEQELTQAMIKNSGLDHTFKTKNGKMGTGELYSSFYEYSLVLLKNQNYKIIKNT
jgi:hypothetical protein